MMSLNNALKVKGARDWTKYASETEIEIVVREADWLAMEFQRVRGLILAEKYAEAGLALEQLLVECPDFLRTRIMGVGYIGIEKIKANLEKI